MKKSQGGFIGIAIVIILAATIGGGIYYKEKINPDFLSKKDDSGERLPIKVIDKKTGVTEDTVKATATVALRSENDIAIRPPTLPSTSVSLKTDVKICTDIKCFTDAISACASAKFTQSSKGELLGSMIDINSTYETKSNASNCDFKLTLNSYKITPSAGLLSHGETFQDENGKIMKFEEFYKELNVKSQTAIGKSMVCTLTDTGSKKAFIEIVSKSEGYKFMLGDDSCKGELITTMEKVGK